MNSTLPTLIDRLNNPAIAHAQVIPWSSPVPSFGDPSNAVIATLGLNPSNREFVDDFGAELDGANRRFHTLKSLGLNAWPDASDSHYDLIRKSCVEYFIRNPYDGWFKRLDNIISGSNASYYGTSKISACHLDLVPYATSSKWGNLSRDQRDSLLDIAGDTLGMLIRESPIRILVLNGNSVVNLFQKLTNIRLESKIMPEWMLPRKSGLHVNGFAYKGFVKQIGGIDLPHKVLVLGYNHNIQSSFGVTKVVTNSIREWIATTSKENLKDNDQTQ